MTNKDHEVKAAYWRKVISECNSRSSDITKLEWLHQHQINRGSFYKWQRALRDEAIDQINEQKQFPEPRAFVDITPAVREEPVLTASVPQTETLTPEAMILVNGYPVYVSSSLRAGTLETIVKVLKNA